jgi:putative inorganic carbon (hco3(-)) transporter
LILGLILAEALLFIAGALLGHVFLAAAAASALVFFGLAYRNPGLAWAIVWIAFPFSVEFRLPGGNAIYAPTEPMMILALLAWALRAPSDGRLRIPHSPLNAPLVVLALVALCSVALSHYPLLGLKAWIVALAYAGFAYGFCFMNLGNAESAKRWIPWVVGAGAFWGLFGAIKTLAAGVSLLHAYGSARPFFPEHGTYSAYLAMILPLALLTTFESRGMSRFLYAAATLAIGLGVALSFTRAAWLSVVLALPLTAVIWALRQRSFKPVAWACGLAAVILISITSFGAQGRITSHAGSVTETENVSNLERVNRWMAAAQMTKDHPWLGVGYGTYAAAYPEFRRKVIVTDQVYFHMGAHSEPLRVLSETGVAGFVVCLWLLVAAAAVGVRVYRGAGDARASLLALAVLSGLATYVIHSVFNSYPGVDKVTIPFWASIGLLAGLGRKNLAR